MDIHKIKNIVAAAEDACVDYPFEDDFETAVLRRASSRKWFGVYIAVPKKYFGEGQGSEFCLNLKCPPELSEMLRQTYRGIVPAWHMNKTHWITVRLHADVVANLQVKVISDHQPVEEEAAEAPEAEAAPETEAAAE